MKDKSHACFSTIISTPTLPPKFLLILQFEIHHIHENHQAHHLASQIPHPQRVRPSQELRIDSPTDSIDNSLIRGYGPVRELRKTHRLFDHDLAVCRGRLPQRIRISRRAALMLLREPEDHLVADKDTKLLL